MTKINDQNVTVERLGQRLAILLGDGIGVACSGITADASDLYPEELMAVSRAVPKRQREFATGRVNARLAMAQIGEPVAPIPSGADRAPVWPQNLVGSISHTNTACVAVVGRKPQWVSVGIDLENDRPMDPDLWTTICTPAELKHLLEQPAEARGRLVTRLFSAKEAVYKWQYPLTGCMLDFQQVQVRWLSSDFGQRFAAELDSAPSLPTPEGQCLTEADLMVSWVCTTSTVATLQYPLAQ